MLTFRISATLVRERSSRYPPQVSLDNQDRSSEISAISGDVGIKERTITAPGGASLNIYPNPARRFLAVNTDFPVQSIRIYDVCGKLVKERRKEGFVGEIRVSLKGMSAGVYFVKAKADKKLFIAKTVVSKWSRIEKRSALAGRSTHFA